MIKPTSKGIIVMLIVDHIFCRPKSPSNFLDIAIPDASNKLSVASIPMKPTKRMMNNNATAEVLRVAGGNNEGLSVKMEVFADVKLKTVS